MPGSAQPTAQLFSADDEAGEQRAGGQQSGTQVWRGDDALEAGAGLLASKPGEKEMAAGAERKAQSVCAKTASGSGTKRDRTSAPNAKSLTWTSDWIQTKHPKTGAREAGLASSPSFLCFQLMGDLGNTTFESTGPIPASTWVTPTFELTRHVRLVGLRKRPSVFPCLRRFFLWRMENIEDQIAKIGVGHLLKAFWHDR